MKLGEIEWHVGLGFKPVSAGLLAIPEATLGKWGRTWSIGGHFTEEGPWSHDQWTRVERPEHQPGGVSMCGVPVDCPVALLTGRQGCRGACLLWGSGMLAKQSGLHLGPVVASKGPLYLLELLGPSSCGFSGLISPPPHFIFPKHTPRSGQCRCEDSRNCSEI